MAKPLKILASWWWACRCQADRVIGPRQPSHTPHRIDLARRRTCAGCYAPHNGGNLFDDRRNRAPDGGDAPHFSCYALNNGRYALDDGGNALNNRRYTPHNGRRARNFPCYASSDGGNRRAGGSGRIIDARRWTIRGRGGMDHAPRCPCHAPPSVSFVPLLPSVVLILPRARRISSAGGDARTSNVERRTLNAEGELPLRPPLPHPCPSVFIGGSRATAIPGPSGRTAPSPSSAR